MLRRTGAFFILTCSLTAAAAHADDPPPAGQSQPASRPHYIGTSLFMLMNLVPDDHPPVFLQMNAGYEITPKDRLSLEAISWRYYHPIGIPWGRSRESADKAYPGHVREYGLGLAYQRSLWKGIYTSVSAVPFWRQYYDQQGDKIGSGFQLFVTGRVGYHQRFWNRLFIEPSVAFTYWPLSSHVPPGFAAQDAKWPKYFLFEPGLHAGVVF